MEGKRLSSVSHVKTKLKVFADGINVTLVKTSGMK